MTDYISTLPPHGNYKLGGSVEGGGGGITGSEEEGGEEDITLQQLNTVINP